jgi:flagellin
LIGGIGGGGGLSGLVGMHAAARIQSAATLLGADTQSPADLIAGASLDQTLATLEAETNINARASNQAATADGALQAVSSLLTGARTLAVANAGNTLSPEERQANQIEFDSILNSIDRISDTTSFNGQRLLDGSAELRSADDSLAIDDAASSNIGKVIINSITHTLADAASGKALNIVDGNLDGASLSIDAAIDDIAELRGKVGSFEQGVVSSQAVLSKSSIQLSSALSQIRDIDYAMEASRQVREKLLAAAGNYAIGYAGAYPGGILSLLA